MDITFKIDTTDFKRSLSRFALYSKKDRAMLLCDATRSFLRRAIDLTPPSQGKANGEAKKRGEMAIDADLSKLFAGKPRSELDFLAVLFGTENVHEEIYTHDHEEWDVDYSAIEFDGNALEPYHRSRRYYDGHGKIFASYSHNDDKRMWVPTENLEAYKRKLYKRVGSLAAGWNAAALDPKINLRVPAWIKRHGNRYGSLSLQLDGSNLQSVVVNEYHGNVRGLEARINQALGWVSRDLDRRVDYYLEKSARRAGFR